MNQYRKGEEPKNLMSGVFDTQDGHGGRATEHREEMETIARAVCAEALAQFESRMYEIAYIHNYSNQSIGISSNTFFNSVARRFFALISTLS